MERYKFLFLYIIVMVFCTSVFLQLYPHLHPMGGIRLPLNKSEIEDRVYHAIEQMKLAADGFHADAVLRYNAGLMRKIQTDPRHSKEVCNAYKFIKRNYQFRPG